MMFEMPENIEILDDTGIQKLQEKLDVNISIKPKQRQANKSVLIKAQVSLTIGSLLSTIQCIRIITIKQDQNFNIWDKMFIIDRSAMLPIYTRHDISYSVWKMTWLKQKYLIHTIYVLDLIMTLLPAEKPKKRWMPRIWIFWLRMIFSVSNCTIKSTS